MIAIVVVLLILIYSTIPVIKWYQKRAATIRTINKIPGIKAYPLIGTTYPIFGVHRKDVFKVIDKILTKYPYIIRSWIGSRPEINIRKAEYIEKIISTTKNMEKPFAYKYVKQWLGEGLITGHGAHWFNHRKIITPTFHFSILEGFCEIFSEKSKILVKQLSCHADSGAIVNIHEYVTRAALDIISESAMGIQLNCQTQHENDYVKAVYEVSELVMHRAMRPYLANDIIYRNTSNGKRFQKCLNTLHKTTMEIILNRKAVREENKRKGITSEKRLAFLDLLLDINEKQNLLSDVDIREEVDTFMFAGHDTTAAAISWTLYLLGLHSNIQEQVFEELEYIFNESDRPLALTDLNEMKYLERVIKESMRLYTPVPFIGRILSEDVHLDQYTIPKGTTVRFGIYYLHRDPRHFPDPEKFDPDRFLPENTVSRHPYAYLPFSGGSRNCIGQKFAMYEVKSMLSSIVRNYKIVSVESRDEIDLVSEFILRTYNGINVKLERRM